MSKCSVRMAALAALVACASLWTLAAQAQVYRIVDPDGRVTFSDRPPVDGRAAPTQAVPQAPSSPSALLPLELRTASSRFPFVLYTSKECAPCDMARSFLAGRGVPFAERTVATDADVRALRSLSGATRLPFATLGAQHLLGFAEGEWSQYLDAAGYPKASVLPPGYRNPAPTPLVALEPPRPADPTAQAPARNGTPAPQPLPSDPSPSNPLGLRF